MDSKQKTHVILRWLARQESNLWQLIYKISPITTWVLANMVAEARIERAILRTWAERDTFSPLRCITGLTNPREPLMVSNFSAIAVSAVYSTAVNNHTWQRFPWTLTDGHWKNLLAHIRLRFQNFQIYICKPPEIPILLLNIDADGICWFMTHGVSLSLPQAFFDTLNQYDYPIRNNQRIGEERKLRPFDALRFSPQAILHYFDIIPQRQRLWNRFW